MDNSEEYDVLLELNKDTLINLIVKYNNKVDFINFLIENSYNIILNSKMFDEKWYNDNYRDVKQHDFDSISHYLLFGYIEGCNPNSNFDSLEYAKKNKLSSNELNPFVHYIISQSLDWLIIDYLFKGFTFEDDLIRGIDEILKRNLFDEEWYLNHYPDVKSANVNPLQHYLFHGYKENRNPSPFFVTSFYLSTHKDVAKIGLNPLIHYAIYGIHENRICSPKEFKNDSLISNRGTEENDDISRGTREILRLGLFDKEWYLNRYPDVNSKNIDPLSHYLNYGSKEGRWPSPSFCTNYYLDIHKDVAKIGLNPLIHYAIYGIHENRPTLPDYESFKDNSFNYFDSNQIDNILSNLNKKVSIIIPIFNAFDEVKKCIESILKNTKNINYEIILVNDQSTDSRIAPLLKEFETKEDNFKIITNSINKGFVKSVNVGMENTDNDVVLLNSDTEVTHNWLQKLIINAYSDEKIGTVTPLSNAAGIFSVPEMNYNEIPSFLTIEGMGKLVERSSKHINMEVPTGNGFCMFIKRVTIDEVGYFDEENFGKGYGEENDFCMRALKKGWKNIIDDSTYIFHKESASFSSHKEELKKRNGRTLLKLHPDYSDKVRLFLESIDLNFIETNVKNAINESNDDLNKKRILYVLHEDFRNLCGTGYTNLDLIKNLEDNFEIYILTSDTFELTLWKKNETNVDRIMSWQVKWDASQFYDVKFRDVYFNILYSLNFDLIQFDHLVKQTFDLPKLAKQLGIPSILVFHDFYYICPSINLLDNNLHFCNAECKDSYDCSAVGLFKDIPKLQDFLKIWRMEVSNLFSYMSAFISPTYFVMDMYKSIFPELNSQDTYTIYHGRDFDNQNIEFVTPIQYAQNNRPVKILVPGNVVAHKGAFLIKKIKECDINNRIEFHFMGKIDPVLKDYGIFHGKYAREDFKKIVGKIKPSFIGIFTICAETFCHVLSEAWDCKIPVIATNLGAPKERIEKTGGGILVDYKSPKNAYDSILNVIDDIGEYNSLLSNVANIDVKSTSEMANDYKNVYDKFLNHDKKFLKSVVEFNKLVDLTDFKDFNDYLASSTIDPLLRYPFSISEKRILKLMDVVATKLIRNVDSRSEPLVSIIMPTYNRAKIISNAINSVLNQTYTNFELIIVDDGSTDNTLSILENYDDDKIKIVNSILNKGASHARNLGLKASEGEYIFYLDSDNDWHPNYLKGMVGAFLELPDADAIYSGQYLFRNLNDNHPFAMRFGSFNKSLLKNCNYIDINCFAHKKEVYNQIGGFDECLQRYVDWDYILKIDCNFNIYSVPIVLSNYYHYNANNRISDIVNLDQTQITILENISNYNYFKKYNVSTNQLSNELTIVIINFELFDDLENCINSIGDIYLSNVKIVVMCDESCSTLIKDYLVKLSSQIDNFNYFYYSNLSEILKCLRNLNYSNILITDVKARFNHESLVIFDYYANKLNNWGIIVPQQIILRNNNLIGKLMPYSNSTFDADINLSKYNTNILNLPIYHDGKIKELSKAPFFCLYIKQGVLDNFEDINVSINSFNELIFILSDYIKFILNLKIYYVAEIEIYRV